MGTRINVLFAHHLVDWTDRPGTLSVLEQTLPECQALSNYWTVVDPDDSRELQTWIAEPQPLCEDQNKYLRYTGPGALFLTVNSFAVRLHTGGRWRAFLSIQELRTKHVAAFFRIVHAFGANRLWCFPDNDFVDDAFLEGKNIADCIQVLTSRMGEPVPLTCDIDPALANAAEHSCPLVCYVATLS